VASIGPVDGIEQIKASRRLTISRRKRPYTGIGIRYSLNAHRGQLTQWHSRPVLRSTARALRIITHDNLAGEPLPFDAGMTVAQWICMINRRLLRTRRGVNLIGHPLDRPPREQWVSETVHFTEKVRAFRQGPKLKNWLLTARIIDWPSALRRDRRQKWTERRRTVRSPAPGRPQGCPKTRVWLGNLG
jgi:hypothetical protein